MLKTAPDHAVCRPHAATLPTAPTRHPLELLADRAATRLAGCTATLIAGCYAPAMRLVTIASPTTMRLEAMVDEARLELLAEGPPDRILVQLDRLHRRAPMPTLAGP